MTLATPDALLIVDKKRNGSFEGAINLWLHEDSLQLTENSDRRPRPFMTF